VIMQDGQFLYQVMGLKLPLELLVMTGMEVILGIPEYTSIVVVLGLN